LPAAAARDAAVGSRAASTTAASTTAVTFEDHFSDVSAAYAVFRPRYLDALFDYLARVAPARDAAWDVGTGTGQAAVGLARHFAHVIATDASHSQIDHATSDPRISYRVAPAEASGLDDASVDLVTVAQALHWFDRSRFWEEARRVLRPRGVIAVWTYVLFEITPAIDAIIRDFYSGIVGPFWPPERRIVEERYQTIEFPFTEIAAPKFEIEQALTLEDAAGYVRTWSATRAFIKHHRRDPVDDLVQQLTRAWGAPKEPRVARWPVSMRVGRVA
jgi:SAM-dependent methyltransferase